MKVSRKSSDEFSSDLTREELRILKDYIVNLNNDMGDDEMSTRVGATRPEVRSLLDDLLSGLRS
jgi:hypothetical protein